MNATRRVRGFSLVEVTLALGIAVFCIVVIFGLLSVSLNTSVASVEQTNASNLLAAVASDLRSAPVTSPKGGAVLTTVYKLAVPAAASASASPAPTPTLLAPTLYIDGNGQAVAPGSPTAAYQLNVWVTPGAGRNATIARLMLSWPPGAATASAAGTVETLVALDRN